MAATTPVFISATSLHSFYEDIPSAMREECLLFFGSKRAWLFPNPASRREVLDAKKQPGRYHLMDAEFKEWILEKEKRGQVHFLKRKGLAYMSYPGPPDENAYARASAWFSGDLENARDHDDENDVRGTEGDNTPRLAFNPLILDGDWWMERKAEDLIYSTDPEFVVRNFEFGTHDYAEVCELLIQSDSRLVPYNESYEEPGP